MDSDHTAVRVPLALLRSKAITVLCDRYQELFLTLASEERDRKELARLRLAKELLMVDLVGLTVNRMSALAEEYRPS